MHTKRPGSMTEEATALAREFGVALAFELDEPAWWSRLHNPLLVRWRLELAVLVTLLLVRFVLGLALGHVAN